MRQKPARKPPRNLDRYWKLEAANAVLVPAAALWLGWPQSVLGWTAMVLAIIAVAGFLIVGSLYWRGVDRRVKGLGAAECERALRLANRAERPLLATTAAAAAATVAAFVVNGGAAATIAAALLTLAAALEYVNYYRRQLQHFDNWSDFKRLVTSGRPRRAHMARDLEAYRRR